jgi:hypothetical protein
VYSSVSFLNATLRKLLILWQWHAHDLRTFLNGKFKQLEWQTTSWKFIENNIKHLYPSVMSLKVLVQKLGSSNVVVSYCLSHTHRHGILHVVSEQLPSTTTLLSSYVCAPF